MPFTNVPTLKRLGPLTCRIPLAQVGSGQVGTIGLYGDVGADFNLHADFPSVPDEAGFTLSDLVEINAVTSVIGLKSHHVHVTKSEDPFRIAISNDEEHEADVEIWVRYHHSSGR